MYHLYNSKDSGKKKKARPTEQKLSEALMKLCNTIEDSDKCQFTIKELRDILKNFLDKKSVYTEMYLKNQLQQYFKDRTVITNVNGKQKVLCLSDTAHLQLLTFKK